MQDLFMGVEISKYKVIKYIGGGAIGKIYSAYNEGIDDSRAIKFIPNSNGQLRAGWENEIIKVNKLRQHENVVKYHEHNTIEIGGVSYLYIMWDYIESDSLKEIIEKRCLTIPMLVDIVMCCLRVLHACEVVGIVHADLHSGNILIQKENELNVDPSFRKIWVTDFGYLTQYSGKEYLDDYDGLNRIIQDALRSISYNHLDGGNKKIYSYLKQEYCRYLLERNTTMGSFVRNARELLEIFQHKLDSINAKKSEMTVGIGDFLAAEHLGEYYDEWKALFVPKFIAVNELLERNICVLTGLRGCGKTMLFRRLTALFNIKLGDSGIKGSDSFYGFYLNARNIPEAFPWLPDFVRDAARDQVINHFNLSWSLEILIWLKEVNKEKSYDLSFLNTFIKRYYPKYFSSGSNIQGIHYLIDLVKNEIINSRLQSKYSGDFYPLSNIDFLEVFVREIKSNLSELNNKPFYLFLDDYSTPMVKASTQLILNPIIMRRSADVIFKVSTESVESFVPIGLNGKALEETADYRLIDCGTLALSKSYKYNEDILFSILRPRIERHKLLMGRTLTLEKLLGKTHLNNEEMAKALKDGIGTQSIYQGYRVFCDIWSSDVREMINLLADMISKEESSKLADDHYPIISDKTQHEVYVEAGGQFMNLLGAATNPEESNYDVDREHVYASHLVNIVKSFQEIASYELRNRFSKNLETNPIKKARRIEILSVDRDLPEHVKRYYKGLIRYGIFIRDNRGKSVRGKVVPRLILRGALIPYFKITFSKRDSISMSWESFISFLEDPLNFTKKWKDKMSQENKLRGIDAQTEGGSIQIPMVFTEDENE